MNMTALRSGEGIELPFRPPRPERGRRRDTRRFFRLSAAALILIAGLDGLPDKNGQITLTI